MTVKEKSSGNTYLVVLKKGFPSLTAGFWVSDNGTDRFIKADNIEELTP